MMTYRFAIPVQISYCVDESYLNIESLRDIKKIQKEHEVDLGFVIDEYEYKLEMNEDNYDDDCPSLSKQEIFDIVINELWDDIMECLNINYDLSDLDDSTVSKIFKITSQEFNKSNLSQYYNKPDEFEINMVDYDIDNSVFIVEVKIENGLNKTDIENIRKFIEGQCSDGWGEGFEQRDISEYVDEKNKYVYVVTWVHNKDVKFLD